MADPPFSPQEFYKGHGWRVSYEEAPLPNGKVKRIARVYRCDTAHIIAITETGNVLLIREFRPFFQEYVWMLPTGRVNKEPDPKAAALRELQEETGYRAGKITFLCKANHSEGFPSENHVFVARNLTKDPLPPDDTELIEVQECTVPEAIEKIFICKHVHMPSAFGLLRYARENGL
ncbi:MAG: NUDIX hydrolase [Candidatus Peregrinibacteria bacterium]